METKQTKRKPEVRTIPCRLTLREAKRREDGTQEESRTITGTAIVFGVPYDVEDWRGTTYREIIAPSAATMDFLKTQDIKMNLLHRRDYTLARWNKGEGNLRVSVDKKGVNFEFEAPRCDIGDRALELVKAGVYSGCSFEFWSKDYETKEETDENGKTVITVTHTAFESIDALTIAMDPAYEQTSVSVDELREKTPQAATRRLEEAKALNRERDLAAASARARKAQMENNKNFIL